MFVTAQDNRLIVDFVTKDEEKKYYKLYGWKIRQGTANLEDTWVNRLILDLPIPRPRYVAQREGVAGLLDFQKADVDKMIEWGSSLNANDMGLGKTIEALAYFHTLGLQSAVILTKKTCISQWVSQIRKWLPNKNTKVIGYISKKQKLPQNSNAPMIVVTNYEKLVGNCIKQGKVKVPVPNAFGDWLAGRRWDVVIADEAHEIRNMNTAKHILADKIPSKFRVGLTGTPIVKHPDDLYGILHWINPQIVGSSYWTFVDYFCNVDTTNPWGRKIVGLTKNEEKLEILRKLLDMIYIRNKIEDVLSEMPEATESVVLLDMSPKQEARYKQIKELTLEELSDDIPIPNGLVQTIRLLQQSTCPMILDKNAEWGPKYEFIGDWLENDPDLRITVFSPYSQDIYYLEKYLETLHIKTSIVTGQKNDKQRAEALDDFTSGKTRVFAGTIGAVGTGTDGLQKACHICIFLQKDWNPEPMKQAIARVRRLAQEQKVLIFYLECAHTVDQRVGKISIQKVEDIRRVIDGEDVHYDDYRLL